MYRTRYFYKKLNNQEQKVYEKLYEGILSSKEEISIPCDKATQDAFEKIYHAISDDHPELYYIERDNIHFRNYHDHVVIYMKYLYTRDEITKINQAMKAEIDKIVRFAQRGKTDYEKEKLVYEYFATHYSYDERSLGDNYDCEKNFNHSIAGALLKKNSVCEGFAKTFLLIMNRLNIDCILVSGKGNPGQEKNPDKGAVNGHAWNMVKLEGTWYYVDVTWGINLSTPGFIAYDYLNVSEKTIRVDHYDFSGYPPARKDDDRVFRKLYEVAENPENLKRIYRKHLQKRSSVISYIVKKDHSYSNDLWSEKIKSIISKTFFDVVSTFPGFAASYSYSCSNRGDYFIVNIFID